MAGITEYTILRSRRKTIAIEITPNGDVIVRCPRRMAAEAVYAFVCSKQSWIQRQLQKLPASREPRFTAAEMKVLREKTREIVTQRAAYFAPIIDVEYGRIAVRAQHTRWGSCSSKGNLNFNCLLALVPREVLDYVVVHELCHRKQMNHSAHFWADVATELPGYRESRKWLKENGGQLMARLP
jgi:predicted metal-dependent hydrolase